jgi:hypothetical protein
MSVAVISGGTQPQAGPPKAPAGSLQLQLHPL